MSSVGEKIPSDAVRISLPSIPKMRPLRPTQYERCLLDTIDIKTATVFVWILYLLAWIVVAWTLVDHPIDCECDIPLMELISWLMYAAGGCLFLSFIAIKKRISVFFLPFLGLQVATIGALCGIYTHQFVTRVEPRMTFYALTLLFDAASLLICAYMLNVSTRFYCHMTLKGRTRSRGNIEIFANPLFGTPSFEHFAPEMPRSAVDTTLNEVTGTSPIFDQYAKKLLS